MLFKNKWILNFNSQLKIAFFTAINHRSKPLRKKKSISRSSKLHGTLYVNSDWLIWIHFVHFCVLRFVSCNHNYDWKQWKTQLLWRRLLNFRWKQIKSMLFYILLLKILNRQRRQCQCLNSLSSDAIIWTNYHNQQYHTSLDSDPSWT